MKIPRLTRFGFFGVSMAVLALSGLAASFGALAQTPLLDRVEVHSLPTGMSGEEIVEDIIGLRLGEARGRMMRASYGAGVETACQRGRVGKDFFAKVAGMELFAAALFSELDGASPEEAAKPMALALGWSSDATEAFDAGARRTVEEPLACGEEKWGPWVSDALLRMSLTRPDGGPTAGLAVVEKARGAGDGKQAARIVAGFWRKALEVACGRLSAEDALSAKLGRMGGTVRRVVARHKGTRMLSTDESFMLTLFEAKRAVERGGCEGVVGMVAAAGGESTEGKK